MAEHGGQCSPQPFMARPAWLDLVNMGCHLALIFFQDFIFVLLVWPLTACSLYFLLLLVRGCHLDFCDLIPRRPRAILKTVTRSHNSNFKMAMAWSWNLSATKVTISANGPSRRLPLSAMPRPPGLIKILGQSYANIRRGSHSP